MSGGEIFSSLLVLQTSVRQILTPPDKLGRVGATITTAIYGVRPIGALAAGLVAGELGATAALWFAGGLFGLSALAIVLSPAARLRTMPVRSFPVIAVPSQPTMR